VSLKAAFRSARSWCGKAFPVIASDSEAIQLGCNTELLRRLRKTASADFYSAKLA
jgi:hypothetical protein